MVKSYESIAQSHPWFRYKYAESGFSTGGVFKPHKTHQNGLSVDFMVPVKNGYNQSVYFPTDLTNKYGYAMEFDEQGLSGRFQIDYEAMAIHILALNETAKKMGYGLKKVIFDPVLQQHLFKTAVGNELKDIVFSKKRVWVRHDEHYHIDFDVPCSTIEQWQHQ